MRENSAWERPKPKGNAATMETKQRKRTTLQNAQASQSSGVRARKTKTSPKSYMAGLTWSALPGDAGTPHRFAAIIEILIREYRAGIIDDKMKNGVVDLLSTLSHLNMKEALARLLPFIAGDVAPDGQIVARRLT